MENRRPRPQAMSRKGALDPSALVYSRTVGNIHDQCLALELSKNDISLLKVVR